MTTHFQSKVMMGIFDLGLVNFLLPESGWVNPLWFGFGFGNFPLKISNFQFFQISLGQFKKYPGQRRVSLLYTASQRAEPASHCIVVMGLGQNVLTLARSIFLLRLGRSAIFGFGLENFP